MVIPIKIELIFDCFPPEIVGGSIRAYHFCKYLTKFGNEVFVVTKKTGGMMRATSNDFPIPTNCYVHRNYGKSISFVFPGFGYLPLFLLSALKICRKYDIDVIHGSMPSAVNAVTGYIVSKYTKKPFVLGIRDPWIRAVNIDYSKLHSHAYIDPTKGFGKYLYKLEEKICARADAIVVTNPSIKEEVLKVHPLLQEDKFKVIYNAADLDNFKNIKPKKFDKFTILYSGVMYKARAMGELINAMEYVDNAQLLITGSGPESEVKEFLNNIRNKNLSEKVKYLGVIPNEELYSYYLGADLLFAGLDMSEMNRYLLPSKVFNYMAAGKPILATGVKGGDLEMIIKKYQCGIFLDTTDPKNIADTIEYFKDDISLSKKLGKNGRDAVENIFNREQQIKELIKVYESVI